MTEEIRAHTWPYTGGAAPTSPLGHRLMFVALTSVAFCLFAPTVLLPLLGGYGRLLDEERRLTQCVSRLQRDLEHRKMLGEAFAHDTVINERLAILDLNYKKPGEVVLPVLPADYRPEAPIPAERPAYRSALFLPDHWPDWALDAERWAQSRGLIPLFLEPTLRPVFLLMSAGLVIAAFILFAPAAGRRPPAPPPQTTQHELAAT